MRVVPALDEVEDGHPGLGLFSEAVLLDQLALKGGEKSSQKARCRRRLRRSSWMTHPGMLAPQTEGNGGVLAPLIRVQDEGLGKFGQADPEDQAERALRFLTNASMKALRGAADALDQAREVRRREVLPGAAFWSRAQGGAKLDADALEQARELARDLLESGEEKKKGGRSGHLGEAGRVGPDLPEPQASTASVLLSAQHPSAGERSYGPPPLARAPLRHALGRNGQAGRAP